MAWICSASDYQSLFIDLLSGWFVTMDEITLSNDSDKRNLNKQAVRVSKWLELNQNYIEQTNPMI